MSHPRTAVAQWHALKAWRTRPPKVNNTFKTLLICTSLNTGTKSHPTIFLPFFLFLTLSSSLLQFFPAVCLWRLFLYSLLLFFSHQKEAKHCQEDWERKSCVPERGKQTRLPWEKGLTSRLFSDQLDCRTGWILSSLNLKRLKTISRTDPSIAMFVSHLPHAVPLTVRRDPEGSQPQCNT